MRSGKRKLATKLFRERFSVRRRLVGTGLLVKGKSPRRIEKLLRCITTGSRARCAKDKSLHYSHSMPEYGLRFMFLGSFYNFALHNIYPEARQNW